MFDSGQLRELSQTAVQAAVQAGHYIRQALQENWQVEHKADKDSLAAQVVTAVDRQAQQIIIGHLAETTGSYDLALLAEETADDHMRLHKKAFWCIDPLDGTLAFIRRQAGFHVAIALVSQSGQPLLGVSYDPLTSTLYHSIHNIGSFINHQPLVVPQLQQDKPLTMLCDTGFADHPWFDDTAAGLDRLAQSLGLPGADIKLQIGAVNNACEVLTQVNRVYFKYARQGESGGSLWDYAATASLFTEAKAVATDIYGNDMELNRSDSTYMNHRGILYATDRQIAAGILQLAGELTGSRPDSISRP